MLSTLLDGAPNGQGLKKYASGLGPPGGLAGLVDLHCAPVRLARGASRRSVPLAARPADLLRHRGLAKVSLAAAARGGDGTQVSSRADGVAVEHGVGSSGPQRLAGRPSARSPRRLAARSSTRRRSPQDPPSNGPNNVSQISHVTASATEGISSSATSGPTRGGFGIVATVPRLRSFSGPSPVDAMIQPGIGVTAGATG